MAQDEKMTQDAWLFKLINKNKLKIQTTYFKFGNILTSERDKAENIRDLSDSERAKVIEQMKNYWANHERSSKEFLVNGAVVSCSQGTMLSKIKGKDHGVYTDSIGGQALLNEDDRNIYSELFASIFGSCKYETGKNKKCKAEIFSKWYGTNQSTQIGEGKASLTMSSYMNCPFHSKALIQPVTSGQEFNFSDSLFKYPKFVVESREEVIYSNVGYWNSYNFYKRKINMTIIRKLAIRNMSFLNPTVNQINSKGYYERKWLEYLAKYVLLCDDKNILKNIINAFYEDVEVSIFSRGERCELLENYSLLMESALLVLNKVIEHQNNEDYLRTVGILPSGENSIIRMIENYFLLFIVSKLYTYTLYEKVSEHPPIELKQIAAFAEQRSDDIEAYYKNGVRIDYATHVYYANKTLSLLKSISESEAYIGKNADMDVVGTYTYISPVKSEDDVDDIRNIWKYFDKGKATYFRETLLVNVVATVILSNLDDTVALVASLLWTVVGSFAAQKAEETLQNKFDEIAYEQSGDSLMQLIKSLKAYIIYANIGKDYHSFVYNILPGKETEKIIYTFLDNIGKIYLKDKNSKKEECLLEILELGDNVKGTTYERINQLIKALTTTISIRKIPGVDIDGVETGMGILKNLKRLSVEGETKKEQKLVEVEVNVLLGGEKISIEKFNCCTATGINMDTLFGELLRRN